MRLYHYRPIENALLELENGTFHFAAREELNDPIEGYVHVFWQGDKAAWEGLFRNYICSISQAIELYLLQGNEDMLHHWTLIVDIHRFDDVPLGKMLEDLGNMFLADQEVQRLAGFYGNHALKVREAELQLILYFIHKKAMALCMQKYMDSELIPREQGNRVLEMFSSSKEIAFPFAAMEQAISDEEGRAAVIKVAGRVYEDMKELQYIQFGFDDETFLYGKRRSADGAQMAEDVITEARQRRNWTSVVAEFPKIYIAQLKDMIYPESYVVCFSGKNDDSAMWGNYADCHRGVCLVYDTDEVNAINLKSHRLSVKPVKYGGDLLERNFFESFGQLNIHQIAAWLTGTEGISGCYGVFSEEELWRNRYWETFDAKTYRKLKTWEHENEYRIALSNTFHNFDEPQSRNLAYEYDALKGVVFGIKTSEYDKKRIVEMLLKHADELTDFTFYQAEYDDEAQRITVREKSFWKLKEMNRMKRKPIKAESDEP